MNNQILETADAQVWAKEFVKMVKENPAIALDEETMIGWFSNAIMAGYDFAQKKALALAQTPPPSITCPVCGKTSYNPNDIINNFCGNCQGWLKDGKIIMSDI